MTGGAGFIGRHVIRHLLNKKYDITVLDVFDPQVHGKNDNLVLQENANFRLVKGDVRDRGLLGDLVRESDAVIHLAAKVGVGQSMYEVERYVDNNTRGTACLLDLLVNEKHNVKKLVLASSMSVYGEGSYCCPNCGKVYPDLRLEDDLKKGQWDPCCPNCQSILSPEPTSENKPLKPSSIYGMSKRQQEEMSLLVGKTYGIPTVAFRFFNVYGPGQALSNPYTGCIAIFSSRILKGNSPIIFEDGKQQRDFIFVKDLVRAIVMPLETHSCDYQALNVGSGKPITILEIATLISSLFRTNVEPKVTEQYRVGDIRHCYADTRRIEHAGFKSQYGLEEGLRETLDWAIKQNSENLSAKATGYLKQHNLIRFGSERHATSG